MAPARTTGGTAILIQRLVGGALGRSLLAPYPSRAMAVLAGHARGWQREEQRTARDRAGYFTPEERDADGRGR